MPRYIDADELLKKSIRIEGHFDLPSRKAQNFSAINVTEIFDFPTADVAPVVHGHNKNLKYAKCDEFRCSVCGIHLEDWNLYDEDDWDSEFIFKFCPNCGAKMDGDINEGQAR